MSQPMNRATILNMVYTMQADAVANAYADLASENERLKSENKSFSDGISNCGHSMLQNIDDKIALAKENERLRRAGDDMMELIEYMTDVMGMTTDHEEVSNWKSAKEGRDAK